MRIVIVDTADEIWFRRFLFILILLSMSELYNWPPSKIDMGSELNNPRLKLMKNNQ